MPGWVLLRALARSETLEWVGGGGDSDAQLEVEVITFEWKEGDRRQLTIDRSSGRLLRLAWTALDHVTAV